VFTDILAAIFTETEWWQTLQCGL